jgi:hypothetical protein
MNRASNPFVERTSNGLRPSAAIGSMKRGIVLEASDDIDYLAHIRRWFEEGSRETAETAQPARSAV